jgi:hypothetical protein
VKDGSAGTRIPGPGPGWLDGGAFVVDPVASVAAARAGGIQSNVDPVRQGDPAIDLMFLIERLDALIEQGRRVPMTNSVAVDRVAARRREATL